MNSRPQLLNGTVTSPGVIAGARVVKTYAILTLAGVAITFDSAALTIRKK